MPLSENHPLVADATALDLEAGNAIAGAADAEALAAVRARLLGKKGAVRPSRSGLPRCLLT